MSDGRSGILRLLVSARNKVLGTALPGESLGSSQILHGDIRAEYVGGKSPPLEPARLLRVAERQEASWTLSKRDAAVWEAAKGALTASQQSEIGEKRRVTVEQTRSRHRSNLTKKLQPCPSSRALC